LFVFFSLPSINGIVIRQKPLHFFFSLKVYNKNLTI